MWLDKIDDEADYPEKYNTFVESFKEKNPSYEYKLWNMRMIRELFDTAPLIKYKNFFFDMKHHIEKCDFARYALLYTYGGLYCDLDFKCNKPLDPLLDKELLLVLEPKEHNTFFTKLMSNSFMGSVPKHSFWLGLMDDIMKTYNNILSIPVISTTGPMKLGSYFYKTNIDDESTIIPTYYVFPYNLYNMKSKDYKENEAYIETYWTDGTNWGNDIYPLLIKEHIFVIILIVILILAIIWLLIKKYFIGYK
jgi:mannosyltransferase OCH1-like enzyme